MDITVFLSSFVFANSELWVVWIPYLYYVNFSPLSSFLALSSFCSEKYVMFLQGRKTFPFHPCRFCGWSKNLIDIRQINRWKTFFFFLIMGTGASQKYEAQKATSFKRIWRIYIFIRFFLYIYKTESYIYFWRIYIHIYITESLCYIPQTRIYYISEYI